MISKQIHMFGGLGAAVIEEDDSLSILDPAVTDVIAPCTEGDLRFCQENDPAYFTISSDILENSLAELLSEETQKNDSLFFMLASLDRLLNVEIRRSAAEVADGLLKDIGNRAYCQKVLLSKPLPNINQIDHLACPDLFQWTELHSEISAYQGSLSLIWEAWKNVEDSEIVLDMDEQVSILLDVLLGDGAFRKLSTAILERDRSKFNQEIINFSTDPLILRQFPSASKILARLRSELEKKQAFAPQTATLFGQAADDVESKRSVVEDLSNRQIYEQVTKQKEGIRKLLLTGNLANVDRAVAELLKFHDSYGDQTHLAKTLCSLSKIALEVNEPHLAEFLISKAVDLDLDDIVIYTSRAEVSKSLGRFTEAAKMYENVLLKYGNERYALCGYADTLKDQGRFSDSEKIYKTAIDLFPDDPVPFNGFVGVTLAKGNASLALRLAKNNVMRFGDVVSRVVYSSLLRDLGRYTESIQELEKTLARFSHEVRVWSSLIRSLSLAGRFEEALLRCEEAARKIPDHPAPMLSKGEVLRLQGKFAESLAVYSSTLKMFTSHRPAQIGKASILILLGREKEAHQLLAGLEMDSEVDWLAYHALCVSLLKANKVAAAVEKLEFGINNVPWQRIKSYFSDSLGYAMLCLGNATKAITYFKLGLDKTTHEKKNGALLLLSVAYTELGQNKRASELWHMSKPTISAGGKLKASLGEYVIRKPPTPLLFPSKIVETASLDLLLAA